jgi:glycolate oxidase subunit GlcD
MPETKIKPLSEAALRDLRAAAGAERVLWREIDLALYSYDSAIDRARPSAVVLPETAEHVAAAVRACNRHGLPFVARGAGTNLCGGTIPLHGAVVIAPTRMKRILSIDPEKRIAVVEPGLPNLHLKKALEPYGLFYAPDPASQKACTLGGNIGTNAGGPHCLKYGVTSQHILGLELVLPDGEITELDLRQQGPDLAGLIVGSEGTLGIVTRTVLNLVPIPPRVETMLVAFPSLEAAIQTVTDIVSAGIIPATLEAMDKITVNAVEAFVHAGYPTDAEAVLLIEVDGGSELKDQVEAIRRICGKNGAGEFRLAKDEREREKLWEGRRGSYPAMARLAPNVLVEDGAVPRNLLPEASRRIREIARRNNLQMALLFHAGDGNLHPQILFDERDAEQTRIVKQAGYEMLKACVDLGGSISGEHGIGIDKREAMRWLFTPQTLNLFRRIKNAFDPRNLCNPDKLIPLAEPEAEKTRTAETAGAPPPASEEEVCRALSSKIAQNKKIFVRGSGSRSRKIPEGAMELQTDGLCGILEHDEQNFTVTVQAGIKIDDLQDALARKNQKVLLAGGGTVGGAVAENAGQQPRLRDQLLGLKVALSDGTIADFGGKVMKNVAGYDGTRACIGSKGTLGVILRATLKTFPLSYPEQARPDRRDPLPANEKVQAMVKKAFDPVGRFPSLDEVLS